jgi:hypothetical protein
VHLQSTPQDLDYETIYISERLKGASCSTMVFGW